MVETLSPVLSDITESKIADILQRLSDKGWTLATAESCTGGLLSSLFTDVPGFSHAFIAGFIVYGEEAKIKMLGIPAGLLATKGAVSEPVARLMAEEAVARAPSDFAIAVTGFAGAAGPGEEAGLVHFATARRDGETCHQVCHFGDRGRGEVRLMCIRTAVAMLHEQVVT